MDKHNRPQARDVAELIRRLYDTPGCGAGCCLHILTDDGNIGSADFCLEVARSKNHPLCIEIAEKMMLMKRAAIGRACSLAWKMEREERVW